MPVAKHTVAINLRLHQRDYIN